jgi:hypothetical protein
MKCSGEKAEVLQLVREVIKNKYINPPTYMENMPLIHLLKVSA